MRTKRVHHDLCVGADEDALLIHTVSEAEERRLLDVLHGRRVLELAETQLHGRIPRNHQSAKSAVRRIQPCSHNRHEPNIRNDYQVAFGAMASSCGKFVIMWRDRTSAWSGLAGK